MRTASAKPRATREFSAEAYQRFLYARGYLLSAAPHNPPKPDWRRAEIAGLNLSYDAANRFAIASAARRWPPFGAPRSATVAILGYVLDTASWSDDEAQAAQAAARALARSDAAFLDLIDGWSGRFLVICQAEGTTRILTDACALRSAYYSFRGGLWIASHARITAEAIGAGPCPVMEASHRDPRWKGSVGLFPGNATPFEDVWVLTPNTLIEVEERRVRRFFPRAPLQAISARQCARRIAPILRRSAETVAATYGCVASLTGGIDSRVTLAASRRATERIEFFTYVSKGERSHEADCALASEMAARLGLSHRRLDLARAAGPVAEALSAALAHGVFTKHVRQAVWAYCMAFPGRTMHLRSNLGEIGRGFYRKTRPIFPALDAKAMADVFKPKPMSDEPGVLASFERFQATAEFTRIEDYDPYDMLYWEHRMSTWHTGIVLGTDVAFDTFIVFNNRRVLMPLLGVPLEDRIASTAFTEVISILWPELLRWEFR